MAGDSWAASVKADWPARTLPEEDCGVVEDFLANTTAIDNRQKMVQIRACVLRKRIMIPHWKF
jgi:hypothetical protein